MSELREGNGKFKGNGTVTMKAKQRTIKELFGPIIEVKVTEKSIKNYAWSFYLFL